VRLLRRSAPRNDVVAPFLAEIASSPPRADPRNDESTVIASVAKQSRSAPR
jgi:hypothetical protein